MHSLLHPLSSSFIKDPRNRTIFQQDQLCSPGIVEYLVEGAGRETWVVGEEGGGDLGVRCGCRSAVVAGAAVVVRRQVRKSGRWAKVMAIVKELEDS